MLFILGRLTKTGNDNEKMPSTVPQKEMDSAELSAAELIGRLGCTNCHGQNLEGTKMGPALANLSSHWNKTELTNYLRNPAAYSNNARFKSYKQQYPNVIMPAFGNVNVQELGKISEYLLSR